MATTILGIATVGLLAGMTSAVQASDIHRKQSNAETVLLRAVEMVKAASYVECNGAPTSAPYTAPAVTAEGVGVPSINLVEIWNGTTFVPWWTPSAFQSTGCGTSGGFDDKSLQRITITVKSLDNRATESTTFIKRQGLS